MNIHGNKIVLRAMEKTDCEFVRKMFNNPELENLVVGWSYPISAYSQEQWFLNHYSDQNNFRFVIDDPNDGAVGIATLTDIDWKNKRAMHGMKIADREFRSKGIGKDAVMAIMRYAFDELGLHRIDGSWFEDNSVSIGLYTKLGWRAEGLRREYIYKGGIYRNLVFSGILASDYYKLVETTRYWEVDN